MVLIFICIIVLVYFLFNSEPKQSFLLTKYKVVLGFLSVTASLVRNIPAADLGLQLKELLGDLDFLNLNITGLFFSAFSCVIPSSDTIENQLYVGISAPMVVCVGVVLWRHRKVYVVHRIAQDRQNNRQANDRGLAGPLQGGEEEAKPRQARRGGNRQAPAEVCKIFDTVMESVHNKEFDIDDFDAVDRQVAERLFKSYDHDGGGEVDVSEMMTMCSHMESVKFTPTQVIQVMKSFDDDAKEVSLNMHAFVAFLAAYKEAVKFELDDAGKEEESDAFSLFPEGSQTWVHDQILRANGKMWKNCLLTRTFASSVPPAVFIVLICDLCLFSFILRIFVVAACGKHVL
jgi:hypothetical protein